MTNMNLMELAEACERLTGPDREVDANISEIVTPWLRTRPCGYVIDEVPAYTACLDAAMTLVPERWKLRQMAFSAPCADDRKWHLNLYGGKEGRDHFVGRGSSPAVALTAAALRAIASTMEDDRG